MPAVAGLGVLGVLKGCAAAVEVAAGGERCCVDDPATLGEMVLSARRLAETANVRLRFDGAL